MGETSDAVITWLLDGDPAIRWQVYRDLTLARGGRIAKERSRVGREGWGAQLLDRRGPDGAWAGLYSPKWTSATYSLLLLRQMGLPGSNRAAEAGATLLLETGLHSDGGINWWRRWRRNSETCVSGMVLAIAARFAARDRRLGSLVEYLLSEQMPDGGWNCERYRGATHSSLHTTISVLEGLLEYEADGGPLARPAREARERAHEFLFLHRMYRSHRTGAVIDPRMTRFAFPPHWHYDVLRGLDYLRAADAPRDERAAGAVDLVVSRRANEGTWPLQNVHRGRYYFVMEEAGAPSRWNTLRALRVLRWWESSPGVRRSPI